MYAHVCAKRAQVHECASPSVCERARALAGRAGVVEVQRSVTAVLGQDVVLPCRYRAQEQEHVVQVTWLKRGPGGSSAEVAVLNREHGEHVQEPYAGRVMRRAGGPLEDGAIVLRNAVQGDEGDYECHLITFPMGSFEGRLTLKVLDLSDASVLGHTEEWQEGMEGAALTCLGDGNPPPTYNWTRLDAPLPAGVRVKGDTLIFQRPLAVADAGDYICHVSNRVAAKEARANVSIRSRVADDEVRKVDLVSASVVVVGVIAAVLLCVLVVVVVVMTLYHKRKTKRISEKYEEELTLTRENSIRRLHSSHSTDTRAQLEETLQLRAESRQGSLRGDSLRGDSLRGTSICSAMSEEPEGRSYSTLSTVREIETQTEVPAAPPGKEPKEEEEDGGGEDPIKQAMTHFVQENGMLQAKPTTNGIYINGRGHLV
ncbi:nectin-4 isoform X3 [Lathamus discolor]|uniref:nectin-4 isoform X3 n=1 Tax=Lathamus discolor TaxID=678569 RepID=UPI0032B823EA